MKRKLLFAVMTLITGALSINVQAREDVTSQYITDAALEDETANWALTSNGGNHAWNADNKYHESWHNTFTITQTTNALPAGYYQLSIQVAVEGGNSTTISLQATSGSNTPVAVYPKYSTNSSFSDMAAWWAADANHTDNRNLNRIFTTVYVEEGQTLTATFKQTSNDQWCVYGQIQLHRLTDAEGRYAQIFEAAYNVKTNLDMANGRYKQRFEDYTGGTVTGKKLVKTISGLPKGKYNVTLNGGASYTSGRGFDGNTGDGLTSFYANGASVNVTVVDRNGIGNEEFTDYTASGALVTDGNLEVGYNNSEIGANWFVGSVKYIELVDPYISAIATEIQAATPTELTAGTWYKFTAASSGNFSFTTTTISNIFYTTEDQLASTRPTTAATETMELEGGTTYYINSSSNQSLTIVPQSYTYTVGEATSNQNYIQPGNTVTVTYAELGTDDPTPTLVKNFNEVTFAGNSIDCTPTDNGFSFEVPTTVTAGEEYSLIIPENAIGYSDGEGTYNATQTITLKTPAIFDGTYYLYDGTSKKFLSRGKNFGSRAVVDEYGLPFKLVTDANNKSDIQFLDWENKYLFKTNNTIYTDNNSTGWKFVKSGDNYYLKTADDEYYTYVTNDDIVDPTNNQATATLWTLKSKVERDAIVNAYPATNKENVIDDAGISTTAADFETYLETNYAAKDMTSKVGTAKFTGSAGDWIWTGVVGNPAYGTDWTEGYEDAGTWSQTITGLTPGIYKVTVNGFERKAGYALCNNLAKQDYQLVTAYFKANDEQLPLKSWFSDKEGTNNPNNTSQAATAFNNDKYKNTIYTYVKDGGEGTGSLTLTIGKQDKASGSWVLFNNVTLTYYTDQMEDADVVALLETADEYLNKPMLATLKQAISDAKDALESERSIPNYNALHAAIENSQSSVDSYASMNDKYLSRMKALLESTNVYQEDKKTTLYDNYLTMYQNGTISNADANAMDAYAGDKGTRPVDNLLMPSWTMGGQNPGNKFYQNTWSIEGENDGTNFLLPFYEYWVGDNNELAATTLQATQTGLEANKVYKVSARVRVRQSNKGEKKAEGITMQVGSGPAVDVSAGTQIGESKFYISEYKAFGRADANGNLTINFVVADESNISWLAFKNLKYTPVLTIDEGVDYTPQASEEEDVVLCRTIKNGVNTIVLPFEMTSDKVKATFGDDSKIYTVKELNGTNIKFETADGITANKPALLKTTTTKTATDIIPIEGRTIEVVEGNPVHDVSGIQFVGTYTPIEKVPIGSYVINGGKIYVVDNDVSLKGTRAYFTLTTGGSAKALTFSFDDDEATGIAVLENGELNVLEGKAYDLSGRAVKNPTKGLYIIDGKKVLLK